MKFRDRKDAQLFLVEVGRTDLLSQVNESFTPTQEMFEKFFNSRNSIIPKLKDLKKSQNAKQNWRENRSSLMSGIKSWHKSTEGKQFHRSLGKHLATKITNKESVKDMGILSSKDEWNEKYETLKSLSSLRTHLYIETQYYKPINEQIEFDLFMDIVIPASINEETNLYSSVNKTSIEDLDILCRAVEAKVLEDEIEKLLGEKRNIDFNKETLI